MAVLTNSNYVINSSASTEFQASQYWENTVLALAHEENGKIVYDLTFSDGMNGRPLDKVIEKYKKGVNKLTNDSQFAQGKNLAIGINSFILSKVSELQPGGVIQTFLRKLPAKYLAKIEHAENQFLCEVREYRRVKEKEVTLDNSSDDYSDIL